ncbi:MAG: hypothetical protein ACOCRX_05310 [Candidatus Woesearchaeota archaeon]
MVKSLDKMTVEELQTEKEILRNLEFDSEWQYEFNRLEIKELDNLIKAKQN